MNSVMDDIDHEKNERQHLLAVQAIAEISAIARIAIEAIRDHAMSPRIGIAQLNVPEPYRPGE